MAAANVLRIKVKGKQVHGSRPWSGIDPITISAQIIMGLQTIVSRQSELTKEAAVVTIGSIHGGVRNNIIPEEVQMIGTIRTLDDGMQKKIHERIRRTATKIAESAGAVAEVEISKGYPITFNDPQLTEKVLPTLQHVAGTDNVRLIHAITGAEDFSFFQKKIPGFYFFLGALAPNTPEDKIPQHHTPEFTFDESSLKLGMKALSHLVLDFMEKPNK